MGQVPDILGLPPRTTKTAFDDNMDDIRHDAMPIATIMPCMPKAQASIAAFQLDPNEGSQRYSKMLGFLGFSAKLPLKVAFQADSFPTDNFVNTYAESFLDKTAQVVSQGASAINQMFGSRSATDFVDKVAGAVANGGGMFGSLAKGVQDQNKKLQGFINNLKNSQDSSIKSIAGQMGQTLDTMLSGARVDFPQIWTNSSFTPSYTMTVRLYNPNPASLESTDQYIIGPLASLLLLAVPQSEHGTTYNYPFLHQIECPGIYFLNPCYISNISVIKGGDQQSIAFNQRLAVVDVRIDFGSLYSSIIAQYENGTTIDRPTLRSYLDVLRGEKKLKLKTITYTAAEAASRESIPVSSNENATNLDNMIPTSRYDAASQNASNVILSNAITQYGSLKEAIEKTNLTVPYSQALYLYQNGGAISFEDLAEVFPDEIQNFRNESQFTSPQIDKGKLAKLTTDTFVEKAAGVSGSLVQANKIIDVIAISDNGIDNNNSNVLSNKINGADSLLDGAITDAQYIHDLQPNSTMQVVVGELQGAKNDLNEMNQMVSEALEERDVEKLSHPRIKQKSTEIQNKIATNTYTVVDNLGNFQIDDDIKEEIINDQKIKYEQKVKNMSEMPIEPLLNVP